MVSGGGQQLWVPIFNKKGTVMDDKLGKRSFSQGLHLGHVEQKNLSRVGFGLTEDSIDFSLCPR